MSFLLVAAALAPFVVVDLKTDESRTVELTDGTRVAVRLTAIEEVRDAGQGAMREARVAAEIDGAPVVLPCANYELPRKVGRVQVDCPVTAGYMTNSTTDHWGLRAAARLRLWPAGAAWMPAGEIGYPLRQRWMLTHTQMANEPTYVDRGERVARKKVYYHAGLDLGGAEALAQVVAATDGQVVSLGKEVLDGHRTGSPVAPRYDVIYLRDGRGWYYRYSHLYSFAPGLKLGATVKRGDALGLLGKEGGSGGWSHLHFEIVSRQPSGEWGTQEGFAFLWEAYLREFRPDVMALARPHRYARVGEEVTLDGGRSWVREGRAAYRWKLSDGRTATSAQVKMRYERVGTYSEVLEVRDARGRVAYDFATVNVFGEEDPITINASYFPSLDLKAGQKVTFKVRTFGRVGGEETWDFGDGSARRTTQSDGNAKTLAPNGYAVIEHTYAKPGDYVVTVKNGAATTHLWVPVR